MHNNFNIYTLPLITCLLFNSAIAAETGIEEDIDISDKQFEQVEQIEVQIEQLYEAAGDKELSNDDIDRLEALEQQINAIFGSDSPEQNEPALSAEETEQLKELEAQMEQIFTTAEDDELSDENIKKLEQLEIQMEQLLGTNDEYEPSEEELINFEAELEPDLDDEPQQFTSSKPLNISGGFSFGFLHQSNATFSTESSVIKLLGSDFPRDVNTSPKEDINAFTNIFVNLKKDINDSGTKVFDVNLSGFANQYAKVNTLDYTSLNSRIGIAFLSEDKLTSSIKPYAILGISESGAGSRSFQFGGGLSARHRFTEKLTLSGNASFKNNDVKNNRSNNIKIDISNINLSAYYQFNKNHSINLSAAYTLSESENITSDYSAYNFSAGYTLKYPALFTVLSNDNWQLSLTTLYQDKDFDRADSNVDPNTAREDKSWTLTIANTVPLPKSWLLKLNYSYNDTQSNLSNFEYDNTGFKVSVSRYF